MVRGTPKPVHDILVAAVGFLGTVVEKFHILLHQPLVSEVYDQWQDRTDEVSVKRVTSPGLSSTVATTADIVESLTTTVEEATQGETSMTTGLDQIDALIALLAQRREEECQRREEERQRLEEERQRREEEYGQEQE